MKRNMKDGNIRKANSLFKKEGYSINRIQPIHMNEGNSINRIQAPPFQIGGIWIRAESILCINVMTKKDILMSVDKDSGCTARTNERIKNYGMEV